MNKIRVILELSDDGLFVLARESRMLREEPRKRWSKKEMKEHAYAAVKRIIEERISEKEYDSRADA